MIVFVVFDLDFDEVSVFRGTFGSLVLLGESDA